MTHVSGEAVSLFFRRFTTMLSAGIPSHRAVHYLSQDEEDARLRGVLQTMYKRLESGHSLARAMQEHPGAFSRLMVALVAAGENTGQLDTSLARLADFTEKSVRLRKRVVSSLTYPAVQVVMAVIVVGVFTFFAVPQMEAIFSMVGGRLPFVTRVLLQVVAVTRSPWSWLMAAAVVVALVATVGLVRTRPALRSLMDERVLKLPLLGPVLHKLAVARMLHALAMVLQAGVTLGNQLTMVGEVSGNRYLADRFRRVKAEMMQGTSMFEAFERSEIFPPAVVQMIRVGEESGTLDTLCGRVAAFYDEEVEMTLSDLATLIEPIVMGFMGVAVAGIALALGMPTIQLVQQL